MRLNRKLKKEDVTFMHLDMGPGKITLAIQLEDAGANILANVGAAFCSPKDQFCKKVGRDIALGRLNRWKHFYSLTLGKDPKHVRATIRQAFERAVLCQDGRLPTWALKAAPSTSKLDKVAA